MRDENSNNAHLVKINSVWILHLNCWAEVFQRLHFGGTEKEVRPKVGERSSGGINWGKWEEIGVLFLIGDIQTTKSSKIATLSTESKIFQLEGENKNWLLNQSI